MSWIEAVLRNRPRARVNQVGYHVAGPKRVTIVTEDVEPLPFEVRTVGSSTGYAGMSAPWPVRPDPSSGMAVQIADFTERSGSIRAGGRTASSTSPAAGTTRETTASTSSAVDCRSLSCFRPTNERHLTDRADRVCRADRVSRVCRRTWRPGCWPRRDGSWMSSTSTGSTAIASRRRLASTWQPSTTNCRTRHFARDLDPASEVTAFLASTAA